MLKKKFCCDCFCFTAIEDEYTGPKLEDEKVTLQFMQDLLVWYKKQNKLHRKYAYKILLDIKAWFMAQPSLVDVTIPEDSKFTICGDIHGQFYDLLNIFELNGLPSETNPYVSFIIVNKLYLLLHFIFINLMIKYTIIKYITNTSTIVSYIS